MILRNRVILVTGAGQGIGRALALRFAREGAIQVIVDVQEKALREVALLLDDRKAVYTAVLGDVSRSADAENMASTAIQAYGAIHGLMNNAAVGYREARPHPLLETPEEEWDRQAAVNLKSLYLVSRAVLPAMIEQRGGKIVNIASIGGVQAIPGSAPYCAMKGGVINLTRSMALDYGPYGINVNALAPGTVPTAMNRYKFENPEVRKFLLEAIPLRRFGTPEDIAGAAVFLMSPDSDFITGQVLVVDGGRTIW